MLLQALHKYAEQRKLLDRLPFQMRTVHLLIPLNADGSLRGNGFVPQTTPVKIGGQDEGRAGARPPPAALSWREQRWQVVLSRRGLSVRPRRSQGVRRAAARHGHGQGPQPGSRVPALLGTDRERRGSRHRSAIEGAARLPCQLPPGGRGRDSPVRMAGVATQRRQPGKEARVGTGGRSPASGDRSPNSSRSGSRSTASRSWCRMTVGGTIQCGRTGRPSTGANRSPRMTPTPRPPPTPSAS